VTERIRKKRTRRPETTEEETPIVVPEQESTEETDELLDEIDGLLEDQEILVNFRQKGGQ